MGDDCKIGIASLGYFFGDFYVKPVGLLWLIGHSSFFGSPKLRKEHRLSSKKKGLHQAALYEELNCCVSYLGPLYFRTTSYSLTFAVGFHLIAIVSVLVAGSYLFTCPAQFVSVRPPGASWAENVGILVAGSMLADKPPIPATPDIGPDHVKPTGPPAPVNATEVAPVVTNSMSGFWGPKGPLNASVAGTPGAVYLCTSPDT